jgi:hypothetical protein
VRLVPQMLGRASATLTLDTYSHVWQSKEQQLRDDLERAWDTTVATSAPVVSEMRPSGSPCRGVR